MPKSIKCPDCQDGFTQNGFICEKCWGYAIINQSTHQQPTKTCPICGDITDMKNSTQDNSPLIVFATKNDLLKVIRLLKDEEVVMVGYVGKDQVVRRLELKDITQPTTITVLDKLEKKIEKFRDERISFLVDGPANGNWDKLPHDDYKVAHAITQVLSLIQQTKEEKP